MANVYIQSKAKQHLNLMIIVFHLYRQQDLRLVLKAYALHDPRTGYCQAMAPVAATLLMHMTAEVGPTSETPLSSP